MTERLHEVPETGLTCSDTGPGAGMPPREASPATRSLHPWAYFPCLTMACLPLGVLVATAGRYGFHRDELYFIDLSKHPQLGYFDQPAVVPLLAGAMNVLSGGSLTMFRLLPALLASATCLLAGFIAHQFGGDRRAQVIATATTAASAITFATGHLFSTTTFDVFMWTVLTSTFIAAVNGNERAWLLTGLMLGLGMEVKLLVCFLAVGLAVGLVVIGPRIALRRRSFYGGLLIATLVGGPQLVWQAMNGWPVLEMSKALSAGSSGTSTDRIGFLLLQPLLLGPLLAPIWLIGVHPLMSRRSPAAMRMIGVAFAVLLSLFFITGGKPYYLGGLVPVVAAAAAIAVAHWTTGSRGRTCFVGALVGVSAMAAVALTLPVIPRDELAGSRTAALNYDLREQVGWPDLADAVASGVGEARRLAPSAYIVILAGNYGEAGAISLYDPDVAPVFSPHNALWRLGPPPAETRAVVAVGYSEDDLLRHFRQVRRIGTVSNQLGVDNDEEGMPIFLARGPLGGWPHVWESIRSIG